MKNKFLKSIHIPSSEITPEELYRSRRKFFKLGGAALAGATLAACAPDLLTGENEFPTSTVADGGIVDELGNPATAYDAITTYNNYYEFSTGKTEPARLAGNLTLSPWQVEVSGLVNRPRTYGADELLTAFTQEERVYRLRCVEGWSMVIPWTGFELGELIRQAEPTGSARYVRFVTLLRPEEMPGQRSAMFPWPYTEGLRLDEALHPLTLIATGLYGKPIPAQNGAPLRLVVPWKYGFKSIKGIVKIELVEEQPETFWNRIAPEEYGFYSNVNPDRPHPRWSQATERRIGEKGRRDTLMFNGYAEQVASLYTGMDLQKEY